MNKKIAYCGLNCQTCDAYLATIHNDQKLKEATAKKWAGSTRLLFCRNTFTVKAAVCPERKQYSVKRCVKSENTP